MIDWHGDYLLFILVVCELEFQASYSNFNSAQFHPSMIFPNPNPGCSFLSMFLLMLLLITTASITSSSVNDKLLYDIDSVICTSKDASIEPVGKLHRFEAAIFTSTQSGLRLRRHLQNFTLEVSKHPVWNRSQKFVAST